MRRLAVFAVLAAALSAAPDRPAVASSGRCPQYEQLLAAHRLPVAQFSRIMWRESRCRPGAVNHRSGARGLLQIMPAHAGRWRTCPGLNLSSPSGNVACAARLYRRSGLAPWR